MGVWFECDGQLRLEHSEKCELEWTHLLLYRLLFDTIGVGNTFNLSINRYLSARVFLFPRFDDSRKRSEGQSNFEFNELLSLGLNVNF